jgi:hypothetical protein
MNRKLKTNTVLSTRGLDTNSSYADQAFKTISRSRPSSGYRLGKLTV